MNILEEIAEKTRERVISNKKEHSFEEVRNQAVAMEFRTGFPFLEALKKDGISLICEVKKASPSKGVIAEDFPYKEIAKDYEEGGASAISVLTEPFYFKGSDSYLQDIKQEVGIPVLRKDFVVDVYQIYEAKLLGADAILLICAILDDKHLVKYLQTAHNLGLSAVVEAHDEEEVRRALQAGAKIIGVNNRDLKTFQVDIKNSKRLRSLVPEDVVFVSESGIGKKEDVEELKEYKVDAALIGEFMMRAADRRAAVKEMAVAGR